MIAEGFRQDFRFAARLLFKAKGFCVIASVVLALGICGVTTQLTIINALLFRLLPFPEADRLVTVALRHSAGVRVIDQPDAGGSMRLSDYLDIEGEQKSFTKLGGFIPTTMPAQIDEVRQLFDASGVSANFFSLLGVQPLRGRDFELADDRPDAPRVAIISYELWEDAYGRDPDILNRTIQVGAEVHAVIGVMPEGFQFPRHDAFWIPLQTIPYSFNVDFSRRILFRNVGVVGRLAPGVSAGQAHAEMSTLAQQLATQYPETNENYTLVEIAPLAEAFLSPRFRQVLYAMLGAVIVVLLIAALNVMNLQLAHGTQRVREMAVRSALGATRSRLLQQGLTESVLITLLGAGAGILWSWYCTRLLRAVVVSSERRSGVAPPWADMTMDGNVLGLTVLIVAVVVVLSGMVPAWLASRTNPAQTMRSSGRGIAGSFFNRLTRGLVIAQIGFTGPLLIGSLLMMRSLANQHDFDWGFPVESLATNHISVRGPNYTEYQKRWQFQQELLSRLEADPVIAHAAFTTRGADLYTANPAQAIAYEVEGETQPADRDPLSALAEYVSPDFFNTIELPLILGRGFQDPETQPGPGVAIVNAAFVRRHFPDGNPIGRRLRRVTETTGQPYPWQTIVGLVPDMRIAGPTSSSPTLAPIVYLPNGMRAWVPPEITIVIRGRADPRQLSQTIGTHVRAIDPDLMLRGPTMTPQQRLTLDLQGRSNLTNVFCAFGLVSVLLAMAGLYGVTSFSVNQRTQEFGVRMTLGATRNAILRLVFREGRRQFFLGTAIGLSVTLILARVAHSQISAFLFDVGPFNWVIYLSVALLLAAVTTVACLAPALRATRVKPIEALRIE